MLAIGKNPEPMAQRDLRRVAAARKLADQANERLRAAIVAAHESGETLRDIGRYANLSHQRIYQILQEESRRHE
jgi:DNA-directed RNA polymerase sigma subunit (sigma70/sigma32)